MMKRKKNKQGFTIIELLVALIVLSIGLLGMALMTTTMTRRAKNASLLSKAVNLCQTKLEKIKEKDWNQVASISSAGTLEEKFEFGVSSGGMSQRSDMNELGNTWSDQHFVQALKTESKCFESTLPSEADTSECANELRSLGPYKMKITMAVCVGADYSNAGEPPSDTTDVIEKIEGSIKPYKEPDCRVKVSDTQRPKSLACYSGDLAAEASSAAADDEKIVKVLCTWRSSQGSCFSVASETTLVNLNL